MTDFLIIGGGIAGLSAGARLSALGQVTLLEGEAALGYHTSGRSAALYEPTYGSASTVALNRASGDFFHSSPDILSPRGLLMVGLKGEEAAFSAGVKSMAMQQMTPAEAQAMVPILDTNAITMAGYHAQAWDIDTDLLMQRFARIIRRNGGQVLTGNTVTKIMRTSTGTSTGWQVQAGIATYQARNLINAAGAWADAVAHLAGIDPIGIQPMRRSMARVAAPDGQVVDKWPMLFGPGETWYMKPDAGCLLISPADETPVQPHDAWAEDMTLAQGIALYEARVTTPVQRMISNWAGLRSFAPDRNLVIGRAPQDATFFWMAGQGGYGFQTAPAASHLLADIAAGRAPELDAATCAALSPGRFA